MFVHILHHLLLRHALVLGPPASQSGLFWHKYHRDVSYGGQRRALFLTAWSTLPCVALHAWRHDPAIARWLLRAADGSGGNAALKAALRVLMPAA